jgi:hypothetical protein
VEGRAHKKYTEIGTIAISKSIYEPQNETREKQQNYAKNMFSYKVKKMCKDVQGHIFQVLIEESTNSFSFTIFLHIVTEISIY